MGGIVDQRLGCRLDEGKVVDREGGNGPDGLDDDRAVSRQCDRRTWRQLRRN
jgi:hypothetical protein